MQLAGCRGWLARQSAIFALVMAAAIGVMQSESVCRLAEMAGQAVRRRGPSTESRCEMTSAIILRLLMRRSGVANEAAGYLRRRPHGWLPLTAAICGFVCG